MSVCPKRDNRINALLVTVWLAVRVADVISTASSKVTVISNVPVSSTSPCVQSIEIGCAEPKESAKLRIQTKISGCASGLSLPDAARPGDRAHPPVEAMQFSRAPEEPAALLSTGRNLGRLSAVLDFPHKPIFLLLKTFTKVFFLYLYYLKPRLFNSEIVFPTLVWCTPIPPFASHSLMFFM